VRQGGGSSIPTPVTASRPNPGIWSSPSRRPFTGGPAEPFGSSVRPRQPVPFGGGVTDPSGGLLGDPSFSEVGETISSLGLVQAADTVRDYNAYLSAFVYRRRCRMFGFDPDFPPLPMVAPYPTAPRSYSSAVRSGPSPGFNPGMTSSQGEQFRPVTPDSAFGGSPVGGMSFPGDHRVASEGSAVPAVSPTAPLECDNLSPSGGGRETVEPTAPSVSSAGNSSVSGSSGKRPVGLYPSLSDLLDRDLEAYEPGSKIYTPHGLESKIRRVSDIISSDVTGCLSAKAWALGGVPQDYLWLFISEGIQDAVRRLPPPVISRLPTVAGADWAGLLVNVITNTIVVGEGGTLGWKEGTISVMSLLLPLVSVRPFRRDAMQGRWFRTAMLPEFHPVSLTEFRRWLMALPSSSLCQLLGLTQHGYTLEVCHCDNRRGSHPLLGYTAVKLRFTSGVPGKDVPEFLPHVPGVLWHRGVVKCALSCVTTPSGVQFYCCPGTDVVKSEGMWAPAFRDGSEPPDMSVIRSQLEDSSPGPPSPPRRWHFLVASAVAVASVATGATLSRSGVSLSDAGEAIVGLGRDWLSLPAAVDTGDPLISQTVDRFASAFSGLPL